MRKIIILLSVMLLGAALPVLAQTKVTGSVKGKLIDSVKKESMAEATVTVYNAKDSSVIGYTLANAKGEFEIKNLDPGMYRLAVSFSGYDSYSKNFMISNDFPTVNLNNIYMDRKGTTLDAVVVEGPPIQVKKDTVEFRASAFKVKPNANAEDILKKLPGVQVDKDGNVKAQGEDVQKVIVDGKEFFGTDPKLATKNITADMIESIQVFDDMSDQAKFTKIDDGSRTKTINIKLKKDKKKGYFGKLVAGGGTDDRYESSLSFNKFNGDQRISLLAGSNNLNKQTFSFSDIVSSMGGFGSRGGGGMGGGAGFGGGGGSNFGVNTGNGINTNTNVGLNFTDKYKKVDLTGSYFFSNSMNRNERSSYRQTFFPNDSTAQQTSESISKTLNQNHRFNLRLEYFMDSSNSLLYTPSFTLQHSTADSRDTSFTNSVSPTKTYQAITGVTNNHTERDGYTLNNNFLFRHKFKTIGRTFTLGLNSSVGNSDGSGENFSPYTFYNSDGTINRIRRQDQVSEQTTKSFNNVISASYTEPIANNKLLEFNYAYTNNHNTSDRKVYDYGTISGKYDSLNLQQTNYFENDFVANRIGANFRVQNAKYNYQIGGAMQQSSLSSRSVRAATGKDTTLKQNFVNFFPTANFQYSWSRSKTLNMRYNGRTNQPSVSQLQDVPDVSNPLQIVTGNPSLKQEFTNNINLSYRTFNMASFKFLNVNLSAGNTNNKIVNSIDTVSKGVQLIRPVNLDGAMNANSFVTLGLPLKGKLKGSNFNFNNSIRYNKDVSLLYKQKNITQTWIITQTVGINLDIKQKLNLGLNASLAFNKVNYSVATSSNLNQKYYTQTYSADVSYLGLKNWVFSSDFDYYVNTGRGAGFNQTIPLWNASIAHQLFKKKNGELKLSVNDLLNQNQSISRSVGDNYIQDTRQLVLKRYFLLTFTYNLSKGQRQQSGMPNLPPGVERQINRQFRTGGGGMMQGPNGGQ